MLEKIDQNILLPHTAIQWFCVKNRQSGVENYPVKPI